LLNSRGPIVQAVATRAPSNAAPSPPNSSIARATQWKNFTTAAHAAKTPDLIQAPFASDPFAGRALAFYFTSVNKFK